MTTTNREKEVVNALHKTFVALVNSHSTTRWAAVALGFFVVAGFSAVGLAVVAGPDRTTIGTNCPVRAE